MKTDEIRERFLEFFKKRGHTLVRSDSLVPQNDPTLLFTGAGMNQFKDYFLGVKKDLKRAASSQKCLRTGDLDEVGRTPYHHSFFEMLGNFSFGDYFKKEAIEWTWEFLTRELQIPKNRLRISVHTSDDEALKIWRDQIKIKPEWIEKCGDKSNFWPANAPQDGPNGPCGPCSEIYFDQRPEQGPGGSVEDEGGRFAEIWNLVFTQFDRQEGGKLVPLAQKNIDTGMGLERLACVLQGKKNNYEIDIFQPINKRIEELIEGGPMATSGPAPENFYQSNVHAIADHARAVIFSITDGVMPSNEARGYVIRKLIRRALYRAHLITGNNRPFLYQLVPTLISVMGHAYPELKAAEQSVSTALKSEEQRFLETFESGLNILNSRLETLKNKKVLPGEIVFELYDTYGFPDEMTKKIAAGRGFEIDQPGFDGLMEQQRKRAKDASKISGSIFVTTEIEKKLAVVPATKFLGYLIPKSKAKIIFAEIKEGKGAIVLDQTPFYAESGGQVGDRGVLLAPNFEARVEDTRKKDQHFLHYVQIRKGTIKEGMEVEAQIDLDWRNRAMRNHTATHLLHAVLREILGAQVRQLGSLVHPERLRFDYSFSRPLTEEELRKIEGRVNEEILQDKALQKEEKAFDEAKEEGALAFFGEKYGDRVRVVTVPGISKEFCGGTHCERTGQIGFFVITSDQSIASGVRRMEALTGEGALQYTQKLRSQMAQAAEKLRSTPFEVPERIEKLQEKVKRLEKSAPSRSMPVVEPKELLKKALSAGPYRLVIDKLADANREDLRKISDSLRSQAKQTAWVLFAPTPEKIYFLAGISGDLKNTSLDSRQLLTSVSSVIGGSGGGRQDLAEGGSTGFDAFNKNWNLVVTSTSHYLLNSGRV